MYTIRVIVKRTGNTTPYNGWGYVAFIEGAEEGCIGFGGTENQAVSALEYELALYDIQYDRIERV